MTIINGWLLNHQEVVPLDLREYWDARDCLALLDSIVYKGMRIVVPPSLVAHMLQLIGSSHMDIFNCKSRAREVLYWPGMSADIETVVKDCEKRATYQKKLPKEPLIPFQQVSVDSFEFESKNYIVLLDNCSKSIEVDELSDITSTTIIKALKSQFAHHGIPETVRFDNGAQFTSASFQAFTNNYGFQLETSSPHYHRSNGQAERAVQIVKHLWRKTSDIGHKALLDYRTTSLESTQLSPARMLMGWRLQNILPISK